MLRFGMTIFMTHSFLTGRNDPPSRSNNQKLYVELEVPKKRHILHINYRRENWFVVLQTIPHAHIVVM
jgi:hypothetical protein